MAQFHYTPLNTISHLKKNIQNNRNTFKLYLNIKIILEHPDIC